MLDEPKPKQTDERDAKSVTGQLSLSLKLTKIKTEKVGLPFSKNHILIYSYIVVVIFHLERRGNNRSRRPE